MTVRELYQKLNELIPRTLSCEGDNDGLLCCPDAKREVKKILVTLDVTAEAVKKAVDGGYDVILSHHPFIYSGLKSINGEDGVSAKAIKLICSGISVMSFHTRLDALCGGVNDRLCKMLGLENVEPLFDGDVPLGRVGMLNESMTAKELAQKVKNVLDAPFVLLSDSGVLPHKIAVLGGSGKSMIGAAKSAGADTFISGRLDYHPLTDAPDDFNRPINLIEAGHFYTENHICDFLAETVENMDRNIKTDIFYSNVIQVI